MGVDGGRRGWLMRLSRMLEKWKRGDIEGKKKKKKKIYEIYGIDENDGIVVDDENGLTYEISKYEKQSIQRLIVDQQTQTT